MKFYDTRVLIHLQDKVFNEPFAISSVSLQEIVDILDSRDKDSQTKILAKHILKKLKKNIGKYKVVTYTKSMMPYMVIETRSNQILACAKSEPDVEFVTDNIPCYLNAIYLFELNVSFLAEEDDLYTGFRELNLDDNELASFYSNPTYNKWNVNTNEYVIINKGVDIRKWNGNEFVALKEKIPKTIQFGSVKAKDIYQRMVIDSMYTNQITMIKGHAGTGKTLLALAALFSMLEKHDIEKIVVFCNPVATAYSAKLGFYPGTKDDKLLDSTIGNILSSKLGDQQGVIRYIEDGKLQLLPFSDIRGFDTSGMKAGVLIEEAENLDISLMKLALQRIGSDSRCIIDGDYEAQVDSEQYAGINNGMRRASKIFRGKPCYGEVELQIIYRSEIAEIAEQM